MECMTSKCRLFQNGSATRTWTAPRQLCSRARKTVMRIVDQAETFPNANFIPQAIRHYIENHRHKLQFQNICYVYKGCCQSCILLLVIIITAPILCHALCSQYLYLYQWHRQRHMPSVTLHTPSTCIRARGLAASHL